MYSMFILFFLSASQRPRRVLCVVGGCCSIFLSIKPHACVRNSYFSHRVRLDKLSCMTRPRSRRRQRIGVVNRSSDLLVREPCEFTRTRAEVLAKLMCARKRRRAGRRGASLQQNIRVFGLPSSSWQSDILPQQQEGCVLNFAYRLKVRRRGLRAILGLVLLAASRQFVDQETISCGVDSFERMLKCYGGICVT